MPGERRELRGRMAGIACIAQIDYHRPNGLQGFLLAFFALKEMAERQLGSKAARLAILMPIPAI